MHIDYDMLAWEPMAGGGQKAVLILDEGDTAWNPASTSRALCGPARITYREFLDGGVDAHYEGPSDVAQATAETNPQQHP